MTELRASCFLIETEADRGTGYLIAPRTLATCEHVIRRAGLGGEVRVWLDQQRSVTGYVRDLDVDTDCAIVDLRDEIPGAVPLKLGRAVASRVPWTGFGFPAVPRPALTGSATVARIGVTYEGSITEVDARNADDLRRIALYSDMLAAGLAEPQGGISGGPVAVDGVVVGHFASVFSSAAAPGRPTLGIVFAARAEDVLALLGDDPEVQLATSEAAAPAPPLVVPLLGGDEYHAFISYRSTDREFAVALADRLEGFGFRVFLDQRELVPGDRFANELGGAVDRSKNGIVLVTPGWIESSWCQDEANEMLRRSNAKGSSFRLIPLRLDGTQPPGLLKGVQSLEFTKEAGPVGPELTKLAWALIGRTPPRASAEAKVADTMTDATDKALEELRVIGRDPTRVRKLLDVLRRIGLPQSAATLHAAQLLIGAGHPDAALSILPREPKSLRERQLKALAYSKLKRHDDALDLLEPMAAVELDAETGGILGGIYRRRWVESGMTDQSALARSYATYRRAWLVTGDPYPGINTATMGVLLGKSDAGEVASQIVAKLGAKTEDALSAWDKASLADALLIAGQPDEARRFYEACAADFDSEPQNVAVVRRITRLLAQKLGQSALEADLPTLLPVPRVVAFSGHLTDAPGRAIPRFPEAKVGAAQREIRRRLQELGGRVFAICSAARGGDLIFAELVLKGAGNVRLLLPFPEQRFLETSVASPKWIEKFRHVTAEPRAKLEILREDVPAESEEPTAYQAANEAIIEHAAEAAAMFDDERPTLLTLWNGGPPDGPGGTGEVIDAWNARDLGLHINIDPRSL